MRKTALAVAAAVLLAAAPWCCNAQGAAAASASQAASASARRLRLMRPDEVNRSINEPGSTHTEGSALPQISIPLGKTPPPPTAGELRAVRPSRGASATGVDDAAARCDARSDAQERDQCRARLAARRAAARASAAAAASAP